MEDCSEYKGEREGLASAIPATSPSKPSVTGPTGSRSTSGLLPDPGGPMAIASPAFELGGAIPARYTCDGANVSPPLHW
ncbi:MAG TPA: hypothetical protein VID48_16430 [Solirubrobacteraceae bacterium]|jgi:hypothetical protein